MQTLYQKYGKKCYEKNKQKYKPIRRAWDENNRSKRVQITQRYVKRHKEKVATYNKYFSMSFAGRYRLIVYRHKERKWLGEVLSLKAFTKIASSPCVYCGGQASKGLDRVDNSKGYTEINVVPCCKICNYMKKNHTLKNFLVHIRKIAMHNK